MTVIYRLKEDVQRKPWSDKEAPEAYTLKAGSLVFPAGHTNPLKPLRIGSDPSGYGWHVEVTPDQVEANPTIGWKDFETYLKYIFAGKTILPNVEPIDIEDGVNTIAAWGGGGMWPGIAHVKMPGDKHTRWARACVGITQGGKYDGTGYAMLYRMKRYQQATETEEARSFYPADEPAIVRFAICKHEKKAGANANPSRGWHPGSCTKCGLDMSVDSGD